MYKDNIVLITGTSRGIGLELAKYFTSQGAQVIGTSRGTGNYQHPLYHHISMDLSKHEQILDVFKKQILVKWPRIDILINNAAVLTAQHGLVMPPAKAIEMVNVNLLGAFFVTRESAKLMRKSTRGRIINISSMTTKLEAIGETVYAATKSGLDTMNNIFAKELAPYGITCNTLAISAYDSEMLNQHSEKAKEIIKGIIQNLTIPRKAGNEDIFNVIDFFASEKSSYITAQTIYLGGIH